MSMASGRAWTALGQNLGNIGNLLLQQQELERERQRQAEQDAIAASDRVRLIERQGKQDQIAEGERARAARHEATSDSLELARLQATSGMAPIGVPTALAPSVAGMATEPRISAIGAVLSGDAGFQKVGLSATERAAQRDKDAAYNTMSSLASSNPRFAALPWKEQLNLAGDNTAYDNWRANIASNDRAAAPRPRSAGGVLSDRQLQDRLDADRAALEAAKRRMPVRPSPMPMGQARHFRNDSTLAAQDIANRQARVTRDSTELANRNPGAAMRPVPEGSQASEIVAPQTTSVPVVGGGQASARELAQSLQRQGKSRDEILRALRAAGYNVQ